jgi:prepilin-type N-terminal cleavage/methylation domain-containing protein
MKSCRSRNRDPGGFTLIELSIILVILGVLVSFGAALIGPLTIRAKTAETKETVNADMEGLTGYAVMNNRLADLFQLSATVRTTKDAWTRQVQYVVDNGLASNPPNPTICSRTTSNITLRLCSDAACTAPTTVNNVAFMLLSAGANGNNQTAASQAVGAPMVMTTYAAGVAVDGYAGDGLRPTDEYDDIVKWVTLPELQAKLSCGRCTAYEIWNNGPGTQYFTVNGGGCGQIAANTLIASIGPGGSVSRYPDATCTNPMSAITFTQIQTSGTDVNRNCQVNFNNTDR